MLGLVAHNAVVTSAIFAPHPDLIVPQEPGTEKPDTECKSDDADESEPIPSGDICNRGDLPHTAFVWILNIYCSPVFVFLNRSFKNRPHGGSALRWLHRRHQSVRQREEILSAFNPTDCLKKSSVLKTDDSTSITLLYVFNRRGQRRLQLLLRLPINFWRVLWEEEAGIVA